MTKIQNFLTKGIVYILTPYRGANRVSRFIRHRIERRSLSELIGLPLVIIAFFGAIIVPQTQAGFTSTEMTFYVPKNVVDTTMTPSRFQWPLSIFGISQEFHGGHPGIDLTDPYGTLVRSVGKGNVVFVGYDLFGYGNHVIVRHDDAIETLYAHLSSVSVSVGQKVTKQTKIGAVGATGWATGNHLHFEFRINGISVNPMEVLPEINKQGSPLN